jgi:arylsulfatase
LYNFEKDFNETHDLAETYPSMVAEMQQAFEVEARKYNVHPLQDSATDRRSAGRPSVLLNRRIFTYYPGTVRLPNSAIPRLIGASYSITAQVEIPRGGAEGVLLALGGRLGGLSFYIQDGKLTFAHNVLTRAYYYIAATEPVPGGASMLRFEFAYAGGRAGAGGTGSLFIDDRKVGEGNVPQTAPYIYHRSEGLEIGKDPASPVTDRYQSPFPFTGKLVKVVVEVK